jgi:hypothetical protein
MTVGGYIVAGIALFILIGIYSVLSEIGASLYSIARCQEHVAIWYTVESAEAERLRNGTQ